MTPYPEKTIDLALSKHTKCFGRDWKPDDVCATVTLRGVSLAWLVAALQDRLAREVEPEAA